MFPDANEVGVIRRGSLVQEDAAFLLLGEQKRLHECVFPQCQSFGEEPLSILGLCRPDSLAVIRQRPQPQLAKVLRTTPAEVLDQNVAYIVVQPQTASARSDDRQPA